MYIHKVNGIFNENARNYAAKRPQMVILPSISRVKNSRFPEKNKKKTK